MTTRSAVINRAQDKVVKLAVRLADAFEMRRETAGALVEHGCEKRIGPGNLACRDRTEDPTQWCPSCIDSGRLAHRLIEARQNYTGTKMRLFAAVKKLREL